MSETTRMFEQMKTIKDKVVHLLTIYPHLREDDFQLYSTYLMIEIGGAVNLQRMTATTLLTDISTGKYVHFESVRRTRQKIQPQQFNLRGKNYDDRQKGGKIIKSNIKDL